MALVSMCFSLIQEGIGQKAAMAMAKAGFNQTELIELEILVTQQRIPNYFQRLEANDPSLKEEILDSSKMKLAKEKVAKDKEDKRAMILAIAKANAKAANLARIQEEIENDVDVESESEDYFETDEEEDDDN
jgi:hypothetical protein